MKVYSFLGNVGMLFGSLTLFLIIPAFIGLGLGSMALLYVAGIMLGLSLVSFLLAFIILPFDAFFSGLR